MERSEGAVAAMASRHRREMEMKLEGDPRLPLPALHSLHDCDALLGPLLLPLPLASIEGATCAWALRATGS